METPPLLPTATREDIVTLAPMVAKIEDFLIATLESGQKMGIEVEVEDLVWVIDRTVSAATDVPVAPVDMQSERWVFLDGMSEELGAEREGIFEMSANKRGIQEYAPMSPSRWLLLLSILRDKITSALHI